MKLPKLVIAKSCSLHEIIVRNKNAIYSIKSCNRKATHSIDFPSWLTRNNANILCKHVNDIIMNAIITSGTFLAIWKTTEVSPIPKVKNPSQCKDCVQYLFCTISVRLQRKLSYTICMLTCLPSPTNTHTHKASVLQKP